MTDSAGATFVASNQFCNRLTFSAIHLRLYHLVVLDDHDDLRVSIATLRAIVEVCRATDNFPIVDDEQF